MGVFELVLVLASAVLSAALTLVARWLAAKHPHPPGERSRLPVRGLLVAGLCLLPTPVIGWFAAPSWVDRVVSALPGDVILASATDPWVAQTYAAAAITTLAAIPGTAMLGWLLASQRRAVGVAASFAAVTALCGWLAAGLSLGWAAWILELGSVGGVVGPAVPFGLVDSVGGSVKMAVGLGVSGASVGAISFTAASSRRGLRVALWLSVAFPFAMTLTLAVATPPDPASQLLLLGPLAALWLLGLGLGAAASRLRSKQAPDAG